MCSTSYSSRVRAIFSYVLKVVSYQSFLRLHCYHLTRIFGYSEFVRSSVVGLFNISDSGDIKCDLPKFVSLILSCALLVIAMCRQQIQYAPGLKSVLMSHFRNIVFHIRLEYRNVWPLILSIKYFQNGGE